MKKLKIKLTKHKIISISLILFYLLFISFNVNDIMTILNEKDIVSTQTKMVMEENEMLKMKNSQNIKLPDNLDLSFYASNIYAYSMLEKFNVQVNNAPSKYSNAVAIKITMDSMNDKLKLKNFVLALNYLGFVESVSKTQIILHVKQFTKEDAKRVISNSKKGK